MKEEAQIELFCKADTKGDIVLEPGRGKTYLYYSPRSEIQTALNTKQGDRFLITIEKLEPKGK